MTSILDRSTHSPTVDRTDDTCRRVLDSRIGYSQSSSLKACALNRANFVAGNHIPSLFWKALLGLVAFDVLGFGHNFARMHRFVSRWEVSSTKVSGNVSEQVCTAVNNACVWYPRSIRCVQRSVITTCLMRRCGVPANIVLGAQLLPFRAHAWTEVNGRPINERREVQNHYQVLERF
jgi:hypothetical protein